MDAALWVAVTGGLFSVLVVFVNKWLEIRNTNTAVLAEVQRLLSVLDGHRAWWKSCVEKGYTGYPLIPFTTPVFDLQAKNIGQIDSKMVAQIVRFYGYLKFVNALQVERDKYEKLGKLGEFDKQYLGVLERLWGDYEHAFDGQLVARGMLLEPKTQGPN